MLSFGAVLFISDYKKACCILAGFQLCVQYRALKRMTLFFSMFYLDMFLVILWFLMPLIFEYMNEDLFYCFLLQLITDVNIAVAVEAVQAIGNLARGLRTHFSGGSRFLLPVLLVSLLFFIGKKKKNFQNFIQIKSV